MRGFFVATGKHPQLYGNINAAWRARNGVARSLAVPIAREGKTESVLPPRIVKPDETAVPNIRTREMAALEAALFASTEALSLARLAKLADLEDTGQARKLVQQLNDALRDDHSALHIEEIAGGFQMLTRAEMTDWLKRLAPRRDEPQLSPPMLEVLAIVAYRQPICRADIEAIRGVQVPEILKHLLDRGLLRLSGRDESLGRPFLYGTTRKFLDSFGLRSLRELPMVDLLTRPAESTAHV